MNWFFHRRQESRIPEGLWVKCEGCRQTLYSKELERTLAVCSRCGHHHRLGAKDRLSLLFDDGRFREVFTRIQSADPLEFTDLKPYAGRLKDTARRGLHSDAVVIGIGRLGGHRTVIAAMEYAFMGGSMGSAVGEKLTLAVERSLSLKAPLVIVSCSGGARMQEGILSLMQMAKVAAALARLSKAKLPYISVLTDPTTGGVTASFAMLGDVNIGEPGALIGFAGPRVIEQTIRQTLPEGFQRAEFLLAHGMLDLVVPRAELPVTLARVIGLLA